MYVDAADFQFTSIQLNHSYHTKVHVDKNNVGLWWIMAVGNYNGGELWVYDPHNAFIDLRRQRSAYRLIHAVAPGGPSW